MRTPTGKAFLQLAGQPLASYALRTLYHLPSLISVALVVAADQEGAAAELLGQTGPPPVPIRITRGGEERQDSVAAGLAVVDPAADIVLVHDAARPFVSLACMQACVAAAAACGAAIAALPATDTVKLVDAETIVRTIDRQTIWLAQTPQVFRTEVLRQAVAQAQRDGFAATDDAAVVEHLGVPVRVVRGEATNRKITTPEDLQWAEWYLRAG